MSFTLDAPSQGIQWDGPRAGAQQSYGILTDSLFPDGALFSGAHTSTFTIAHVTALESGTYRASAYTSCGTTAVPAVVLTISPCGTADFNRDGDTATDADIEAFFACLAGNCCPTCDTADFNGDGDTGTDADIESFFRVLAGGNC